MRYTVLTIAALLVFATRTAMAIVLATPDYEVTGTNARLPFQPTKVQFDGQEEILINKNGFRMRVNESMHVVDGSTWLEFSFKVDPGVGLANNLQRPWEVGVTNLQFTDPVYVPPSLGNGYMYFTRNGQPIPMQGSLTGDHPWNGAVPNVWFHPIVMFDPESPQNPLPPEIDPATTLNLFHRYNSLGAFLASVGVPADVDGFHFGCRVVPEPSTAVLLGGGLEMLGLAAALRCFRRRS